MTTNKITDERIEKMATEIIDTISTRLVETTSEDGGSIEVSASLFLNVLRELQELRHILSGLPQDAIDGGWTAAGISAYTSRLESELQERQKPQRPVAFLNDAHLHRGHVEGGVTSDDDAPGMIPVYREPVGVVYVSCLPESEFDELQERRKADSQAQATLNRLAVILHGSEVDLNLLTVTAQSLMDRCKAATSNS